MTQVKKKMFSIESLGIAYKVISIESWLEDTLEKKRKRKDESTPAKDIVSQAVHSGSAMVKVKKQKTLSILGQDPEIGHLTMEIAKPNKEGRIEDMTMMIPLCTRWILERLDTTPRLTYGSRPMK